MKKIVKINKKNNIELYSSKTDAFIVGLKDFSVSFDEVFSCEEINSIVDKYPEKEIFVSVNKNIFNSELNNLEKILLDLDKINVKVLFYDLAILYIKNKNKLNIPLVWNQTHMVTNYNTCNYYYDKGCSYALISSEITLDEIIEISKKSKISLLVQIVGHQTMSHSRRRLLTNYYSSIGKKYDGELKKIYENEKSYLVSESDYGTIIQTSEILNGIPIIPRLQEEGIDYLIIDESYIDESIIIKILEIIDSIINNDDNEKSINDSYDLLGNNTSFFYKKTIYNVKRGE